MPKDSRLRRVDPGLNGLAGRSLALLLSFFFALPRAGGEAGSGTTSVMVSLGALAWVEGGRRFGRRIGLRFGRRCGRRFG